MLFGGIAEQLHGPWRGKRLVIVAAGALELLPFGALPVPRLPGHATARTAVPLIAHHEIVEVPSASVLSTLRRERAAREPARRAVAVLADPVFEATDPRIDRARRSVATRRDGVTRGRDRRQNRSYFATRTVQRIEDTRGGTAVARLPFSRDEANAIASLARAEGGASGHRLRRQPRQCARGLARGLPHRALCHPRPHRRRATRAVGVDPLARRRARTAAGWPPPAAATSST